MCSAWCLIVFHHIFLSVYFSFQLNVEFSYSAHWKTTDIAYANRMDLHSKVTHPSYCDFNFNHAHWRDCLITEPDPLFAFTLTISFFFFTFCHRYSYFPGQSRMVLHESTLEVHWLSIINSFVLVLLLTIFLAFILMRVLRNDVARYVDMDDEDLGMWFVCQFGVMGGVE